MADVLNIISDIIAQDKAQKKEQAKIMREVKKRLKSQEVSEEEGDKEDYMKFFAAKLKKYGVKSPAELSDEDKKKFFDEVDAGWQGDNEPAEEAQDLGTRVKTRMQEEEDEDGDENKSEKEDEDEDEDEDEEDTMDEPSEEQLDRIADLVVQKLKDKADEEEDEEEEPETTEAEQGKTEKVEVNPKMEGYHLNPHRRSTWMEALRQVHINEQTITEKKNLDPVGKEDDDVDNDGDTDDSDKYLMAKRKAISKAISDRDENVEQKIDGRTKLFREKLAKLKYAKEQRELEEKAVSQQQQKLMGMAYAYKKGEMEDASDAVKKLADSMSLKDLKDFASTKREGLPVRKEEIELDEALPPHLQKHFDKDGDKVEGKWINGKFVPNKVQPKSKFKSIIRDVTPKGYGPTEEVEIQEKTDYQLYHKTFSGAMQHAYDVAKKRGYTVDPDEIDNKVATGPKKPSSGKTNKYILGTDKKQNLHVQVANLDNERYELNMYIESVDLGEENINEEWIDDEARKVESKWSDMDKSSKKIWMTKIKEQAKKKGMSESDLMDVLDDYGIVESVTPVTESLGVRFARKFYQG